jgi:hypothetical protein
VLPPLGGRPPAAPVASPAATAASAAFKQLSKIMQVGWLMHAYACGGSVAYA